MQRLPLVFLLLSVFHLVTNLKIQILETSAQRPQAEQSNSIVSGRSLLYSVKRRLLSFIWEYKLGNCTNTLTHETSVLTSHVHISYTHMNTSLTTKESDWCCRCLTVTSWPCMTWWRMTRVATPAPRRTCWDRQSWCPTSQSTPARRVSSPQSTSWPQFDS